MTHQSVIMPSQRVDVDLQIAVSFAMACCDGDAASFRTAAQSEDPAARAGYPSPGRAFAIKIPQLTVDAL